MSQLDYDEAAHRRASLSSAGHGELLRGRLQTPETLERYLLAGRATVTLRSRASGARRTIKVGRKREHAGLALSEGPVFFRAVFAPEEGREDKYLGCLLQLGESLHWKPSMSVSALANPDYLRVASWLAKRLGSGLLKRLLEEAEVWHEGTCGRCGRRLTVPESIETGFGPECAGRVQQHARRA